MRSIGFFLLAAVYAVYASGTSHAVVLIAVQLLAIIGLTLIAISLLYEPVLGKPVTTKAVLVLPAILSTANPVSLVPVSATLLGIIAWRYVRRATAGLDKQLKPAAIAFSLLTLAEVTRMTFLWGTSTNVFWSSLLAKYGAVWDVYMLLQLMGIVTLAIWAWGYIRFRIHIQLFVTIMSSVVVIFIFTTLFFTFLLLKNIEKEALSHLKTDTQVFAYSLDRLQLESLSHARAIAADGELQTAIKKKDVVAIRSGISQTFIDLNLSTLVITSSIGEVIARAENPEVFGDNIELNPLVHGALSGQPLSTIETSAQVNNPALMIKSAVPIRDPSTDVVIGTVVTGFLIDNAFVDGIKSVTGLEATVYAGNARAATTLVGPDGHSRYTGTLETDKRILDTTITKGKTYLGESNVFNEPFYTAYSPIKTYGGGVVGMLFIGSPQTDLYATAQKTIDNTFIGSVVLMLFAVFPVFGIARYIEENLEA